MKNNNMRGLAFIVFLFAFVRVQAQDITGLWEITKVEAGEQAMTPVAKWTRINADGTYQSGNGWLQNSAGTWIYDKESGEFLPTETLGLKDPFGAFKVSFSDEGMMWVRQEEGMNVVVHLERIEKLPMATGDKLVGLWGLEKAMEGEEEITGSFDPDNNHYRFIRWDRIYVERPRQGERQTGYWHIHGHKPELTLLAHSGDKDAESWRVDVNEKKLQLTGISDGNAGRKLIYRRLDEFPE